ncbi:MAG: hypothetical protein Kow0068_00660 [Marinilabiliales bacterium]
MKIFKYLAAFILLIIIHSCSTINVVKVDNNSKIKDYPVFYYLPKTKLSVDISVIKTEYKPGIYAKYSKHLFGIDPLIKKDSISYEINEIKIFEHSFPDSAQLYAIIFKKPLKNDLILTNDNRLVCFNCCSPDFDYNINEQNDNSYIKTSNDKIEFPFYAMKRHLEEVTDTNYRYIKNDSIIKKIPVYNRRLQEKSEDKEAFEIASFIIKLRKRRFRMMTGMDKVFPEDEAAELFINELNKTEKKLLELFSGKTIQTTEKYTFDIIPEKERYADTLCYFSNEKGFVNNKIKTSKAIILKYNLTNTTAKISSLLQNQKLKNNSLVYRIPEKTNIEMYSGEDLLYETELFIPQFGKTLHLSKKILTKTSEIYLNPKTGNINRINN